MSNTPKKGIKKSGSKTSKKVNESTSTIKKPIIKVPQRISKKTSSSSISITDDESSSSSDSISLATPLPTKKPIKKPIKKCNKKSSSASDDEDKTIKKSKSNKKCQSSDSSSEEDISSKNIYDIPFKNGKDTISTAEALYGSIADANTVSHSHIGVLSNLLLSPLELISDRYSVNKSDVKFIFYKYNTDECIYEKFDETDLSTLLFNRLTKFITICNQKIINTYLSKAALAKNESLREKYKSKADIFKKAGPKIIDKVGGIPFRKGVIDHLKTLPDINQKGFTEKLDCYKDIANFSNGYVNLRTGDFFKRTSKILITKYLPYEYSIESSKKITDIVNKIIHRICNDDDVLTEGYKSWFGYCLTGETREHKSMWSIGHSASNGKTTIIDGFQKMYSIYAKKIEAHTYGKKAVNAHKTFTDLRGYRLIYINEIDQDKINIQMVKDHIDGGVVAGNEILYGTTEDIPISFKIHFTGNHNPNFETDHGMRRRGWTLQHTNIFVDKSDYDENKKGIYLKDKELEMKFESDEYKLAFFNILLPYAVKYYKSGFNNTDMITYENNWKDICGENDKMKQFIDHVYEVPEENKENCWIQKDNFVSEYRKYFRLNGVNWSKILNDVKRVGLEYNKDKMCNGKKGCIRGLVLKQNDDEPF